MTILVACVVSAQFGTSAANVALPTLATWSGSGFGAAQWVVVSYLLAMTGASLVIGYLGDVSGRARVLSAGVLVFVAAGIVCALAPNVWVLVGARAVQGIGAAAMAALPLAIARDLVPSGRVGSVMGLLGTASAIGTALGPVMGGLLEGVWGWPAIFWAMVPLPIVVLLVSGGLSTPGLGRTGGSGPGTAAPVGVGTRPRFDVLGSALVVATALVYAMAFTGDMFGTGWSIGLMILAGLLIALLIPVERRAGHPVLPGGLLRTRALGGGAVLNLIVGAVMMSTLIVGPFYLSAALGLSPVAVGLAMAAGPVVSIVSGVVAGRVVDRHAPAALMTLSLGIMSLGAAALAFLPPVWGLVGYLTGTMLLAPGYQLFLAANSTIAMRAVEPARRGTAAGLLGISRNLGLVTGTSLLGSVFATFTSNSGSDASADLDLGLRVVFLSSVVALLAAAVVAAGGARKARSFEDSAEEGRTTCDGEPKAR